MSSDNGTMCIVNPVAGHRRCKQRWDMLDQVLRAADLEYEVSITSHALHAVEITREALKNGFSRIVAVGGDGTLNEVVNGFFDLQGQAINPEARLSLIPVGTGSDFARMFNIDSSTECVRRLLSAGERKTCDVVRTSFWGWDGEQTRRYYINIGDVGIGAETCARINRNSKVLGGFWSFLLAGVYTILTYRNRNLTVLVDEAEIYSGPCCLIAIGNGSYFGGGMKIAPKARLDDGLLDVVVVKNFGKMELLAALPQVYRGSHLSHPKVGFRRGSRVKIISHDQAYLEVDGETTGQGDMEFEILPAGLKILV